MGNCTTELPQEAIVKASQQFDDLELIHRSQAGDTEAFGELVTKYRAKVFTMIYSIVGNENDAWDLAQEAFLKAWRSIHQFEGRSSFYTWLYRITMNLTIDLLRRKARRSEVELDDAIPSFLPGPGVNYDRAEIREQVNAALAQLTPEHRAVIVLKEIEDLHCHEIAEILNISIGTVLSRLFYGRKKLQSILRPSSTKCMNLNATCAAPKTIGREVQDCPHPVMTASSVALGQDPITRLPGIVPPIQRTVL